MENLFDETQPFQSGMLQVSEIHTIYYEQVGNPQGVPFLFIHGGPGGSIRNKHRRFFNPQKCCAILYDQRGCGQSKPFAQLQENDTFNLVEDIEKLRLHLKIEKWAVFGGSWGSTLALLYSIQYPERITYLILRGIFLARRKDVRFFTQQGSNKIFPEAFEQFANFVGYKQGDKMDIADQYYKRFQNEDLEIRREAVKHWGMWECSIEQINPDNQAIEKEFQNITNQMIAITLLQCHFSHNNFFFQEDNFILKNIQKIKDIPCIIIQGRYDAICGVYQAYELHQALPKSELHVVPDAGHSAFEPNIIKQLVASTDKVQGFLQNSKNLVQNEQELIGIPKRFKDSLNWYNSIDQSSFSNIDETHTLHHKLILCIDFQQQILKGKVVYKMVSRCSNLNSITFDLKSILIKSVKFEGQTILYSIHKIEAHYQNLGDLLLMQLPYSLKQGQFFELEIEFQSLREHDEASALNWLRPEQTHGGKMGFMYTQSEPIYTRSIFPCQDSPSIKATFQAQLVVESPYVIKAKIKENCNQLQLFSSLSIFFQVAWASGILRQQKEQGGINRFFFEQYIPISSYLFALVCGNLIQKQVSQRTFIISEPEFSQKSAKEFSDMEIYLSGLQKYTGLDYQWKIYRIVVMPPSFPYGGMENPNLTFCSSTCVVGDQSEVEVVIHQMAHSWSGNLVTCSNWQSFWLNEGMTCFIENEVFKQLKGEQRFATRITRFNADLENQIDKFRNDPLHSSYASLTPNLDHNNPDDAFSRVPYFQGHQFLLYLKQCIGDVHFQGFIQKYIQKFKHLSLETNQFVSYFFDYVKSQLHEFQGNKVLANINWREWLMGNGYPPCGLGFVSSSIQNLDQFLNLFFENESEFYKMFQFKSLSKDEKVYFLSKIQLENRMNLAKLELFDQTFHLTVPQQQLKNEQFQITMSSEVNTKWLALCIQMRHESALPMLQHHLSSIGRMAYIVQLYEELKNNGQLDEAKQYFYDNQNFYHSILIRILQKILN